MTLMSHLWDPPQKMPRGSLSLGHADHPLATHGIAHSTRTEILTSSTRMSHIRNSAQPTFYLVRMFHNRNSIRQTSHFLRISHNRNSVRLTFYLLRIFHIRRFPPDGRGGRFNFPKQTCLDPSATLIRRTSVAGDSNSLDSLARQILAIRWIHFRPQSKSKLRQYWRPSFLNCHSSLMQDVLDKTFPNLLRLPDASLIPTLSSWGLNHQTSRLSLLSA